jgi:predicted component of viral defense system (DUF524 family)
MASPPTSRLRFLDDTGAEIGAPREWRRGLVAVDIPIDALTHARLLRNGEPLSLFAKSGATDLAVFAEWPLSGTGRYRLQLDLDGEQETREITVSPEKISSDAYSQLIEDLQTTLPASIAISLQRLGAFAGLQLRPPGQTNLQQELYRLRRAIRGTDSSPGLAVLLPALARDPYRVLRKTDYWVQRHRARRIEPVGLVAAYQRANNVDGATRLPRHVPDVRVEQTADVYENRVVKSYHDQVALRLRRIKPALQASSATVLSEAEELEKTLRRSRQVATFLDEVTQPHQLASRPTMVLLKRPNYRTLLESFLEFRRTAFVELDEPGLETPLESLPNLYETWGTLRVIHVLLEVAGDYGYTIAPPRVARLSDGGLYIKILPDGRNAIELTHVETGTHAHLTPQRSYGPTGLPIRSISFRQTPDVTLEVARPGEQPSLFLFDPKYKLDSEIEAEPGDGRPKKVDIDKMHAYRDAIRGTNGQRVVRYAAILYPGPGVRYGDNVEALPARPLEVSRLEERLRGILAEALTVAGRPFVSREAGAAPDHL